MKDFETILIGAGVKASRGALDRAYEASGVWLAGVWKTNRDVPVADHVRVILESLGNDAARRVPRDVFEALVDAYTRPALLVPPAVDLGAIAPLRSLGERGYRLALVSNIMRTPGGTLRRLLERHDLLRCFATTVFSDELGVRKPAPEIFLHALRALGVEPAAAVHVGDEEILDVQGARAAGMRAIQVTRAPLDAPGGRRPDDAIAGLALLPEAIARLEA